ncbi:hypothetical protein ACH5RR_031631 [Cinchona calisaya]|uniref:NAC domain-containing protein n=1 Tax=Cinchona calisaya TaxID=153742 RepID=A0ABD2YFT0_9GENT
MAMASSSSVQDVATQADKVSGAKPLAFQPEQLIAVLNNLESGGNNIPADIIRENVYEYHPMQLLRKYGRNGDGPMLFFHELRKTGRKVKRKMSREQQIGQWTATKAQSKIRDKNGSVIGTKTSLVYYEYASDGNKKMQNTGWQMKEFRLPQNETANKVNGNINSADAFFSKCLACNVVYYRLKSLLKPVMQNKQYRLIRIIKSLNTLSKGSF